MSVRRFLLIALSTQIFTLPALAATLDKGITPLPAGKDIVDCQASGSASTSSSAGNADPDVPGAYGSTGENNVSALMGGTSNVATARRGYSYGDGYTAQAVRAPAFNPRAYGSVSECLTAAYAADQPLGQCK